MKSTTATRIASRSELVATAPPRRLKRKGNVLGQHELRQGGTRIIVVSTMKKQMVKVFRLGTVRAELVSGSVYPHSMLLKAGATTAHSGNDTIPYAGAENIMFPRPRHRFDREEDTASDFSGPVSFPDLHKRVPNGSCQVRKRHFKRDDLGQQQSFTSKPISCLIPRDAHMRGHPQKHDRRKAAPSKRTNIMYYFGSRRVTCSADLLSVTIRADL